MSNIFIRTINISYSCVFLILITFSLRFLFRKNPKKYICILWYLTYLRLVFPFPITSAFSLLPSRVLLVSDFSTTRVPQFQSGLSFIDDRINPFLLQEVTLSNEPIVFPLQILSCIWFVVLIFLLCYYLFSMLSLRHKLSFSVRHSDYFYSDRISQPFVFGLFKPKLYIPFNLANEDLTYILAHEAAHIQRRDYFIKPLAFLITTIYWYSPFSWAMYAALCRDVEMACDEYTIYILGKQHKRAYSESLFSFSDTSHRNISPPLSFGESYIVSRIKNVLSYKPIPKIFIVILFILYSTVFMFFGTYPPIKAASVYTEETEWIVAHNTDPVSTVAGTLHNEVNKPSIQSITVISVVFDPTLTQINLESLIGSDRATEENLSSDYLKNNFSVVVAQYDITYNDSPPSLYQSGKKKCVFLLLRDEKSGLWDIWDNLTPHDIE